MLESLEVSEMRRREAVDSANEANREKGEFLANMSRELGNRKYLLALIDDILYLSKGEAGMPEYTPRPDRSQRTSGRKYQP
jgi:hypothetical protein